LKTRIFCYSIHHDYFHFITELKDNYTFVTETRISAIVHSGANNYICQHMVLLTTETKESPFGQSLDVAVLNESTKFCSVVGTILGIHPSDNNLRTFVLHVTTVPGAIGFVSLEG